MTYLVGNNIKLVKFSDRFINARYTQWINDHDINRYLYAGRIPLDTSEISNPNDQHNIVFAIMTHIVVEDDAASSTQLLVASDSFSQYIGIVSINSIDWINRKGDIGYMIGDKRYWGAGLATETVGMVVDYAFNRLNLNKTEAGVVEGNIGSSKVLEKNGFKEYGRIPCDYALEGKYYDSIRYYKLQEW